MPNPFAAPEISVQDVAQKRSKNEPFIWLDVREEEEYRVRIKAENVIYLPLSKLAEHRLDALPDLISNDHKTPIIVYCHHGMRSAQVVTFLQSEGWKNAVNMDGGIEAWAQEIDPSVGTY